MEAHGHEEIGTNVALYLRNLIKNHYPDIFNQIYQSNQKDSKEKNNKTKIPDIDKDPIRLSLYLGNWLTDLSQLFIPDSVFVTKQTIKEYLKNFNKKIDEIFDGFFDTANNTFDTKIEEIIRQAIVEVNKVKLIDDKKEILNRLEKELEIDSSKPKDSSDITTNLKHFSRDFVASVLELIEDAEDFIKEKINNILNIIEQQYENIKKQLVKKLKKLRDSLKFSENVLDYLGDDKFNYDYKGDVWNIMHTAIKLMGYRKFHKKMKMDYSLFEHIIESFISQENKNNDNTKNRFHFRLDQYYPSDHLDRAFIFKIANNKKQANLIDRRVNKKNKIYKYLEDYLEILSGKLTELNVNWVIPTFIEKKAFEEKDFMLNMARLGQTLHGVEDFFSHSNFLELVVNNLIHLLDIDGKKVGYFGKEEYLNILNSHEKSRYENALKKALKLDEPELKINMMQEESNLVTGFYAEKDTATSLYHLIAGKIEKQINETNFAELFKKAIDLSKKNSKKKKSKKNNEDQTANKTFLKNNSDTNDALFYFYKAISEFIKDPNKVKKDLEKGLKGGDDFFTEETFDFIFNAYLNQEEKNIINKDQKEKKLIIKLFNSICRLVARIKYGAKMLEALQNFGNLKPLFTIVLLLFLLILAPEFAPLIWDALMMEITMFLLDIITEFLYTKFEHEINQITNRFFKDILHSIGDLIETKVLASDQSWRIGSHGTIAKDESYRNYNFNYQALRSAVFMDRLLITALFAETKKSYTDKFKIPDIKNIFDQFLCHPGFNKSHLESVKSSKRIKKEFNPSYHNRTIHIIDPQIRLLALFEQAYWHSSQILDKETYKAYFLEYNPYISENQIIEGSNTTLGDVFRKYNQANQDIDELNNFLREIPLLKKIHKPAFTIKFPVLSEKGYVSLITTFKVDEIKLNSNVNLYTKVEQFYHSHWAMIFFLKKSYKKEEPEMPFKDYVIHIFKQKYFKKEIKKLNDNTLDINVKINDLKDFFEFYGLAYPETPYISLKSGKKDYRAAIKLEEKVKKQYENFIIQFSNLTLKELKKNK